MKKITIILLMFLYLIPAIGLTVSVHYCGGKVTSVSFNPFDTKPKCPCGGKKMPKDCCKDEIATFKLEDEQQKSQPFFFNLVKVVDLHPAISINLIFEYYSPFPLNKFDYTTHPPDDLKHPLYIRHCVFRI